MTSFDLVRICLLYVGVASYGWLFDRDVARLRDLIIISVAAPALSKLTHFEIVSFRQTSLGRFFISAL